MRYRGWSGRWGIDVGDASEEIAVEGRENSLGRSQWEHPAVEDVTWVRRLRSALQSESGWIGGAFG